MHNGIFRRVLALAAAGAALCALLTGCAKGPTKMENTIFAMDTVMTLTFYGADPEAALQGPMDSLVSTVYELQNALSATDENSEIYALDHGNGGAVSLSPSTAELLQSALDLCETTGGALDVTAYPAVKAWGFTTGEYRVPEPSELGELASRIDSTLVELNVENASARLPEGMELDLGAVAKGYLGDRLADQLRDINIQSALLDLGQSSIQAVGSKPDGSPWRIGIQDPAGEGYLGVLELADEAIGTSGGYQRFFEAEGVRYWHIIDPDTAAPARSGLASVTVVSPSGFLCDGLSTALFVMGLEEGADFWRTHPELDFDAIFISDDGSIHLTPGLEESFSLATGYEDREVTILT